METTLKGFVAELKAAILLTEQDLVVLNKSCKNHYDSKVAELVKQGGFLYGFNNRLKWAQEKDVKATFIEVELSFRQIDLLLKSLEMQQSNEAGMLFFTLNKVISEFLIVDKITHDFLKNL